MDGSVQGRGAVPEADNGRIVSMAGEQMCIERCEYVWSELRNSGKTSLGDYLCSTTVRHMPMVTCTWVYEAQLGISPSY